VPEQHVAINVTLNYISLLSIKTMYINTKTTAQHLDRICEIEKLQEIVFKLNTKIW